jgi:uncharacterized protein (DUF302 family)
MSRRPRPALQYNRPPEGTKMQNEIGLRTTLKTTFEEAIERTTAALKAEGFGVLTRIDVQSTFKEKINVDFRKYVILGACNPPLAHRALSANADVGLLLPCNVTVQEEGGEIAVTAVDPVQMLGVLRGDSAVSAVAVEARGKLEKVISSLR